LNSKIRSTKGLATGIGSLPHTDVNAALDLIFKYTPYIPFWPQLPKRDMRERMVAQYSQGLPCLRLQQKGISFDSSDQEQELTQFYEHIIANDSEYFKISPDFAAGFWQFINRLEKIKLNKIEFIKGQTTGPFTFAASINDNEGRAILHNSVIMQAVREGLAMKARWQISLFRKFAKPIIMFLDEPYLSCLGSGYTPINRKEVIATLVEFTEKIQSPDVLIGVHCCGNTDWSIFTDVNKIRIISFDAFNFLDRLLLYAENLADFFKRGGILAWGIVPTQAFTPKINSLLLAKKLEQGFNSLVDKGIEEDLIKNNLIITPSCGLGTLSCETADSIFKCLQDLSYNFKNKSI
jgi:methionine synthase II (cobalamin-independent)